MFKKESGDWKAFRQMPDQVEIDFHRAESRRRDGPSDYWHNMEVVHTEALESVKKAQEEGKQSVLFTHGYSTSRNGKTTARSQVRKAMRSKEATPYILRSQCIQHFSVFVAVIRPKKA